MSCLSLIRGYFTEYDFSTGTDTLDYIAGNIYLGSCESCLDVVNNKSAIKYILNLSQYKLHAPEKKVLELNIDDCPEFPIDKYFDQAHQFINEAKNNNSYVLVHCRSGHSRSPTIVMSYMMKYYNMTYNQSFDFVNKKRKIYPNSGFVDQLKLYELRLINKSRIS
jgi:protein-tyrosine phosphatase